MLQALSRLFGTGRSRCFTDLPGELRNKIYEIFFEAGEEYRSDSPRLSITPQYVVDNDVQAILNVSRTVRAEVSSLLWSQRCFSLDLGPDGEDEKGPLRMWMEAWGEQTLPLLRHVRFFLDNVDADLYIDAEDPANSTARCKDVSGSGDDRYPTDNSDLEALILVVIVPSGQLILTHERIMWLNMVLSSREGVI